jgi:SpoIID/LytB domain protein
MKTRVALACAALFAVSFGLASEIDDTAKDAFADFLGGRLEAAMKSYEYIVTRGSPDPDPEADIALLLRDMGRPQDAAAHWVKATQLDPQDAFLWCQRGWNYLAIGLLRESRDCFREAVRVSSGSVFGAEARLGLGMAESQDGNLRAAAAPLQEAMGLNPHLMPAAAAELGRVKLRQRQWGDAASLLTLSIGQDPMQPDLAFTLGRTYERMGQGKAAWQAYKLVLDADPLDAEAAGRKARIERYLEGRPADSIPVLRLARPILRPSGEEDDRDASPPHVRVAMFSGPDGLPRHLTRFYVMGSTVTLLWDLRLNEEMRRAGGYNQWEVLYRPDNRVIEIRDAVGNILYTTRQPFRLEPLEPGQTVLIKSPEVTDISGVDISDRELRGSVDVIPTPWGFHIVNQIPLDMYLFSVVTGPLPDGSPAEAYKAMAVLARARMREELERTPTNPEKTHVGDSAQGARYRGLAGERLDATRAVRATRGVSMVLPQGQTLEFHRACGWATAAGIQDRPAPSAALHSPYSLERLVHGYPDSAQYSEATALADPVWTRWLRVLDADGLRERLERSQPSIGPLRHVRVAARDASGRVSELEVRGKRGKAVLSGFEAIEAFLSAGGLRSGLFTLQPFYEGSRLRSLLVWGGGTGHGRGLCITGALGQAQLGRDFAEILSTYFPGARLLGIPPKPRILPRVLPPPPAVSTTGPVQHRPPRKRRRSRP